MFSRNGVDTLAERNSPSIHCAIEPFLKMGQTNKLEMELTIDSTTMESFGSGVM